MKFIFTHKFKFFSKLLLLAQFLSKFEIPDAASYVKGNNISIPFKVNQWRGNVFLTGNGFCVFAFFFFFEKFSILNERQYFPMKFFLCSSSTASILFKICCLFCSHTHRSGAKGPPGGQAPHFGRLPPYFWRSISPIYNIITTFLTNSSCFQLKSTLKVLQNNKMQLFLC